MDRRTFLKGLAALPAAALWLDLPAGAAPGYAFVDPVGTGVLESTGALDRFRSLVGETYRTTAAIPGTFFADLAAFHPASAREMARDWVAFPRRFGNRTAEELDRERTKYQDEYVEWFVERRDGRVCRVVFTTEFADYYEALAATGPEALLRGVRDAIPGAEPTVAELFGPGPDPARLDPAQRVKRFRDQKLANPWNGTRDILFLSHPDSTLTLLFRLVAKCAIPTEAPQGACVAPHCIAERHSDPRLCSAAQTLARAGRALTLPDPAGVRIVGLEGDWRLDGQPVALEEQGLWKVTRNGRRAELTVVPGLTIGNQPIASGAQVAKKLRVDAALVAAGS